MSSQTPAAQPTPGTQQPGYNIFAILGIIVVWFAAILGLIFGHIALAQIKRTGERGHAQALTAVIVGWIALALSIIIVIIVWVTVSAAAGLA